MQTVLYMYMYTHVVLNMHVCDITFNVFMYLSFTQVLKEEVHESNYQDHSKIPSYSINGTVKVQYMYFQ